MSQRESKFCKRPPTSNVHVGHKREFSIPWVGIDYVTWRRIQKWIPPHIKSSFGAQEEFCNSMDIWFETDYVIRKNLPKWIPRKSSFHLGHRKKF